MPQIPSAENFQDTHRFWIAFYEYDSLWFTYTYKKEKKIFLINKKIQNGAVAKSYMSNGLLIYGEIICTFPHTLRSPSSYMTLHPIPFEFPYL